MITLPDLDDQTFEEIVSAAKARIPVIYPEWTDLNEHDPGITILELFAWLKEMQQYYLDRVPEKAYENMLRLLQTELLRTAPAKAGLCFRGEVPERLIKGTQVCLPDDIYFVLEEEFRKAPFETGDIFIESESGVLNVSGLLREGGSDICPFGSSLGVSGRCMYIGVKEGFSEALYDGIGLLFDVSDKCPVKRSRPAEGSLPPRGIVWEYSTPSGYKPCEVLSDETFALSFSGVIRLKPGKDFSVLSGGGLPSGYWLRARMEYTGCEDMPYIRALDTDFCVLTQKRRLSGFKEFTASGDFVEISDRLFIDGLRFVFIRDALGWTYAENAAADCGRNSARVDISAYSGALARDGKPNVILVFCEEGFGRSRMFHSSNGLPCQSLEFDLPDELLTDELVIMASDRQSGSSPRWNEYRYTDDLSLSGPYDRRFTYDRRRGRIVFGDNENGAVPDVCDDGIMVISCAVTKGRRGNVMRGSIRGLGGCEAVQPRDASGGRDMETIRHARGRLTADLGKSVKAVTAEDYRTLAKQTPGVRVADVKAVPLFDPAAPNASGERLANTVSLIVLPYSNEKFPLPDKRFLDAVREHIENYRLITTNVKVAAPIYIMLDIDAEIVCAVREVEPVKRRAAEALYGLFSVYGENGRARFGESVSDIGVISAICAVDGVLTVKSLRLNISDSRCHKDKFGRMIVPPHAIVCCGDVNITISEP